MNSCREYEPYVSIRMKDCSDDGGKSRHILNLLNKYLLSTSKAMLNAVRDKNKSDKRFDFIVLTTKDGS